MGMRILDQFPVCCLACHGVPDGMVELTAGDRLVQKVAAVRTAIMLLCCALTVTGMHTNAYVYMEFHANQLRFILCCQRDTYAVWHLYVCKTFHDYL
jgi:hypothetical protein